MAEDPAEDSRESSLTAPFGYVIGLLLLGLAIGLKAAVDPAVDMRTPFLLLLGAVMTAAWWGGLLVGLTATLLAAVVGDYLFLPAPATLSLGNYSSAGTIAIFVIEGALVSALCSGLRLARSRRLELARRRRDADVAPRNEEPETIDRLALSLAGELDLEKLVKAVTDAGAAMTGAAFGAFLYRPAEGPAAHYAIGAPPDAFLDFPLFHDAETPGSPLIGAVARSDDLSNDLRFGPKPPFKQMPPGTSPARSYLQAPVRSRSGATLGGLFFGHPERGFFKESDERLISRLAAHAANAVDNANLYKEAQQARASAEAANGLKDEFLSTLSHELRTPLTAILGWAHLLHHGKLSSKDTVRAVDTIIRNATAQNQIIDELLDVSRIMTGKLQLDLRPVDLGAVVKAAIATVTPTADAKGVRLQLLQNPAGSFVMGDPERLQQILWNLLSNSIKFTPKNGSVRVSVESVGSNVEVVVTDTGLGIDREFLPLVFDRFSQDDSSSTRHARGVGLGLSIARQLVELHGGRIDAESAGPGQGSTFTLTFPLSPVRADSGARIYSQADAMVGLDQAPDLSSVTVLVAEDDDDARGLIEKVLETQGATVIAVTSAREALEVLGRDRIDVLLSDIEMPGLDGYQLLRELRLRTSRQGGAVPAVALTAYARTEDRLRALRAGFQLHLAKPVQPSELVAVVASLAARRNP